MTIQLAPQSNIDLVRQAFSALGRRDVDAVVKLTARLPHKHSRHALSKTGNRRLAQAR